MDVKSFQLKRQPGYHGNTAEVNKGEPQHTAICVCMITLKMKTPCTQPLGLKPAHKNYTYICM